MQIHKTIWLTSLAGTLSFLTGCGKEEPTIPPVGQVKVEANQDAKEPGTPGQADLGLSPHLHQSIKDAVLFENPDNQLRPPDATFAKKSVAKIYQAIVGKDGGGGLWDQVRFVNAQGKRLHYSVTFKTEEGEMVIELMPEIAPNHARNFIALARAGYFDGLPFHRTVNQMLDGKSLTYLEGGCPKGSGEIGYGSIGYWLKPELSDKVQHEEGTVGAWHDETLESAACRFYITLCQAPWMDRHYTIFGKITRGLDVARKIHTKPVLAEDTDRPREPVLIREATVQVREDAMVAGGKN